jgi:hypothetical protein
MSVRISVKGIPGPIEANNGLVSLPFEPKEGMRLRRRFHPDLRYSIVGESEHDGYWVVKIERGEKCGELRVLSLVDFQAAGLIEFEADLITEPYLGLITEEDISAVRSSFPVTVADQIDEHLIRQVISENNWNNELGDVINKFTISGDTCNLEVVTGWIDHKLRSLLPHPRKPEHQSQRRSQCRRGAGMEEGSRRREGSAAEGRGSLCRCESGFHGKKMEGCSCSG